LIGSWTASGETEFGTWSDTYTITAGTPPKISHPSSWGDDTSYTNYKDAAIVFVYNFSETAGCLIIKRPDSKYSAVYFKDLTTTSVLLGDAYDSSVTYDPDNPNATDPAVSTLDAAKERFKPANAELYGGGSAQTGTPQTKS
jgi:hypothetical protein